MKGHKELGEKNAGKIRRQQEKWKTNVRWTDSTKEVTGVSPQELDRAVEDKTL